MLVVSREDRCECSMVVDELRKLRDRCKESPEYAKVGVYGVNFFKTYLTVVKGNVRRICRVVDSHGLAVSAIAICFYGLAILRPRRHMAAG